MKNFRTFLAQTYTRLEEIKNDPYPDPAVDSVAIAMLVEKANERARQVGCGHLAVRRDEYKKHDSPVDLGIRAVEQMVAWCQAHEPEGSRSS